MLLSKLIQPVLTLDPDYDVEIKQLISDSRSVSKGDAFFALEGDQANGENYIEDAIKNGAVAVLFDSNNKPPVAGLKEGVPHIAIPQLAMHLGFLAARFHGFPADKLDITGVTGTNGKTSFCQFLAQCLTARGEKTGVVGTLGSGVFGNLQETGFTTPDALTLQSILADFAGQNVSSVAMEVSSHAIAQHRIGGIEFGQAVFTNLSQDHLDYHGDMKTYAAVKRHFMAEYPAKHLIFNVDDFYGQNWANELAKDHSVFAYSTKMNHEIPPQVPHVYADDIALSENGIAAKVMTPWGEGMLEAPLLGHFNLSNALAVLTTLCVKGMTLVEALRLIARLEPIPGRMQTIRQQNKANFVIDYAHTPDALEKALTALRQHTRGKLFCVFGCGGDRDKTKRPKMAKVAEKYSDQVIVTSDNPRHEDPKQIIDHIFSGFDDPDTIYIESDRSKAIQKSIQLSSEGDCVLIAGKGAERYQLVADQKLPFDDVAMVKQFLSSD